MTQRYESGRAQDILARWCAIAEQRLDHLTELYESGRWRRYHSETAFMENIREAKAAVECWQALARREATLDNTAVDFSWLGRSSTPLSKRPFAQDRTDLLSRIPAISMVHSGLAATLRSQEQAPPDDDDFAGETATDAVPMDEECADEANEFSHVAELVSENAPDVRSVQERYPILHHTF